MAYCNKGLIDLFVAFLQSLCSSDRHQAVQKLVRTTGNANKLVLHGLYGLEYLFAFEGVVQIGNDKHKVFFFDVGGNFDVIFLFGLVFLEQLGLHILQKFIDLYRLRITVLLLTNLVL